MEKTYHSKLLKFAAFWMLTFSIVSMLLVVRNGVRMCNQMQLIETSITQIGAFFEIKSNPEGFDLQATALVIRTLAYIFIGFGAVSNGLRILAGGLGLRYVRRPEKYAFFTGWGGVLLFFGILGLLVYGMNSALSGYTILTGVAAPILYLIGGNRMKKSMKKQNQQAVLLYNKE